MNKPQLALHLASFAHRAQSYGSHPYTYHLEGVAELAIDHVWANDLGIDTIQTVCYLHDILEDTAISKETLLNIFGSEVADAVSLLTKSEPPFDYDLYISNIKKSRLALVVKVADATFNLRESALQGNKKRVERYAKLLCSLVGE